MGNVAKLKNLNELKDGIQKQWIWGSKDKFSLSCDYLQKVNYSIQDLNAEIHNLQEPTRKEIIYVIVLVGWICEAVDSIYKILRKEIIDYLDMKDDEKLRQAKKYFKAIRVNFSDLYYVAQLQIDRIYALDLKLRKLTKKKVGIQ